MAKVKSALEIALEKASKVAALTQEEREHAADEQRLTSVLREFYQGNIDSDGLWQQLKGSKPSMLLEAQRSLINTFGIGIAPDDFRTRKQAILAIETLKEKQNTAMIESELNSIEDLVREYQEMKDRAVEDLRRQMEAHPQLRMRPVRTPDGKTVMQMTVSVDEAVKAKLSEFLSEQEGHFNGELSALIADLKDTVM
jgi:phage-related tail protein